MKYGEESGVEEMLQLRYSIVEMKLPGLGKRKFIGKHNFIINPTLLFLIISLEF